MVLFVRVVGGVALFLHHCDFGDCFFGFSWCASTASYAQHLTTGTDIMGTVLEEQCIVIMYCVACLHCKVITVCRSIMCFLCTIRTSVYPPGPFALINPVLCLN